MIHVPNGALWQLFYGRLEWVQGKKMSPTKVAVWPDSEATGLMRRQGEAPKQPPRITIWSNLQNEVKRGYSSELSLIPTSDWVISELSHLRQGTWKRAGRRKGFQPGKLWSILYVSIFSLGTASSVWMALSLLRAFWLANRGSSVTLVPEPLVSLGSLFSLGSHDR